MSLPPFPYQDSSVPNVPPEPASPADDSLIATIGGILLGLAILAVTFLSFGLLVVLYIPVVMGLWKERWRPFAIAVLSPIIATPFIGVAFWATSAVLS